MSHLNTFRIKQKKCENFSAALIIIIHFIHAVEARLMLYDQHVVKGSAGMLQSAVICIFMTHY